MLFIIVTLAKIFNCALLSQNDHGVNDYQFQGCILNGF